MRRLAVFLVWVVVLEARRDGAGCATTQQTPAEVLFLHHQARRARPRATAPSNNRDIGNVAIIEASGGVVETLNQFNLDQRTLTFSPGSTGYHYAVSGLGYDGSAASQGSPVAALGDDDSRAIALPFAFPFYGKTYRQVYLNSDGNLTFGAGDNASSGRSVGRMTGGAPRISPLFDDLDPSQSPGSVRVFADSSHVAISWVNVPEYGIPLPFTFQVRLYVDGRIQFSYAGIDPPSGPSSAVVGIAPGAGQGGSELVDFQTADTTVHGGAVLERFGNSVDLDVVSAAQRFYETHEDAYDYLVIYNNMGIAAAPGAVAYESTVRSSGLGYAVPVSDFGAEYGSGSRLHAVMNMGTLSDYPADPNGIVGRRAQSHDTPLTILGHEAGHLFLAFASVPDPVNPAAKPMIGYGGAHWSFVFNSEASLDEGEQITDRGAAAQGRFLTTAETQGYSPLDRYLMGLGPASDVAPTFVVQNYPPGISPLSHPEIVPAFNGTPLPVTVSDVAQAMGRRTPDYTVAQHRYRFAFILVVPPGSLDSSLTNDVRQVETYRQQFPAAYARFSANLAVAETTLNKRVKLSLFPAAGVVTGASTTATLTLDTAPAKDMTVTIAAANGYAQAPATVTIAAGAKSAAFAITGLKAGVEELTATPSDAAYETAFARVQVADASQLTLRMLPGDNQAPVVVALSDVNGLVYAGVRITASATAGSVTPAVATTDSMGQAAFAWTPGASLVNTLTLTVEAAPTVTVRVNAGSATPSIGAVVNAASNLPGMAPGSIDTIYGANLGDASVALNGAPVDLMYRGNSQINFYVPANAPLGAGTLTVTNAAGISATAPVTVTATDPGIFAVRQNGGYLEIYATGLGPTLPAGGYNVTTAMPLVFVGSTPLTPAFSGLAPGIVGLYQVNVQLPAGMGGAVPVVLASGQTYSNEVRVTLQ